MALANYFENTDGAGVLRCDRPGVARRQLEVSIGVVIVLLIATAAVALSLPSMSASQSTASFQPAKTMKYGVVRAPVRAIPIVTDAQREATHSI
jgi:hypothetical protein